MFGDNNQHTFLEYNTKDNGVTFLVTVLKIVNLVSLRVLILTSDVSPLGILLAMTRVKKEL